MHRLISCSAAVERLWAYLDQDLDEHDQREVEAHLALCKRCCGELELAKHLRRFLATKHAADLPPGVRDRLDRFIDALAEPAGEGGTQ